MVISRNTMMLDDKKPLRKKILLIILYLKLDQVFINKVSHDYSDKPYSRKQKNKWRAYSYQHDYNTGYDLRMDHPLQNEDIKEMMKWNFPSYFKKKRKVKNESKTKSKT